MRKKYSFWLKTAAILQIITGLVHATGFFFQPEPQNDSEKQLLQLMNTYKADMGLGFAPTFSNLFLSMSICFTLLCLFGGWLNFYLLRKRVDIRILKGTTMINLVVFGICFLAMVLLTFLPPIVLTGLVFISLLISFFSFRAIPGNQAV